jgi:hypothetical protein
MYINTRNAGALPTRLLQVKVMLLLNHLPLLAVSNILSAGIVIVDSFEAQPLLGLNRI